MKVCFGLILFLAIATVSSAAVTSSTQHSTEVNALNDQISSTDAIAGLIATNISGDWHPANTDPGDQLAAFTDGAGIRSSGLTGLLNDFPGVGVPAKQVQYDLAAPTDLKDIRILTGSNSSDGRIFSTFAISTSTDNGTSFNPLGYFESDPLGTINTNDINAWKATLVTVFDDVAPVLAGGVTNLRFDFFAVDNNGGQYRDPYDGTNPNTGIDDGLTAAFVSPLVLEIDVNAIPEPTAMLLCAVAAIAGALVRRR